MLVRIPKTFYQDHDYRDLPTPKAHKQTKQHVWVDTDDPNMPELLSDARYYANPYGPDTPGLRRAAKALLKAVEKENT